MKKSLNQLNRKLFIGFALLGNPVCSISANQYEGFIKDEWSWHDSVLNKSLITLKKEYGFWPNYEEMIKEMKKMGHLNALRISLEWYKYGWSRQNSYQNPTVKYKE